MWRVKKRTSSTWTQNKDIWWNQVYYLTCHACRVSGAECLTGAVASESFVTRVLIHEAYCTSVGDALSSGTHSATQTRGYRQTRRLNDYTSPSVIGTTATGDHVQQQQQHVYDLCYEQLRIRGKVARCQSPWNTKVKLISSEWTPLNLFFGPCKWQMIPGPLIEHQHLFFHMSRERSQHLQNGFAQNCVRIINVFQRVNSTWWSHDFNSTTRTTLVVLKGNVSPALDWIATKKKIGAYIWIIWNHFWWSLDF